MKKHLLALTSLGLLASCKSVSRASSSSEVMGASLAASSTEKLPIVRLDEWVLHKTGPTQEPFFMQNQLYSVGVELPTLPSGDEKVTGQMTITDKDAKVLLKTPITMKLRGTTSRDFLKKQYSVTLVDKDGKDAAQQILDMPASASWVFSAPFNDKSLIRDILTYNLSNKMGRYAPRTRIINLTLSPADGRSESFGIYVITEKNDLDKGRIGVEKKNETGTAFQGAFDHLHDGDNVVWSGRNTDVVLTYPSAKKITPEQQAEFMTLFNDVEGRIASPTGPAWDSIFDDRLDLDSAVDFFIGQELSRNADGFRLSSDFYVPIKGKMFFGPLWDFNIAYGNAAHEHGIQWDGWRSLENGVWFGTLLQHPKFCSAVKTRWAKLRADGTLSNNTIFNIIDKETEIMAPIAEANFRKWPSLGRYLWPNPYWLKTWDDEKKALKSWVSLRANWMDTATDSMPCDGTQPENWQRNVATDANNNQFCDEGEDCSYTGVNLVWRRRGDVVVNHVDASRACGALNKDGEEGWRLPRDTEWQEAQHKGIWGLRNINLLNMANDCYWSSNGQIPYVDGYDPSKVYVVDPHTGERKLEFYGSNHPYICVKPIANQPLKE